MPLNLQLSLGTFAVTPISKHLGCSVSKKQCFADYVNSTGHRKHIKCLHASPFLLTTACEHLQTEQASCWTCGKGMCVPCLLCRIFSFTMDQMFSFGERSELQMDWTRLCSWCSLALFYWKMFGLCQKRSGQEYLLDFSALVVPVQTC